MSCYFEYAIFFILVHGEAQIMHTTQSEMMKRNKQHSTIITLQ